VESGDLSGVVLDGRYRVIEPIAEGAMGVVYRAERVKLGRIVAIKVLHEELPAELSSRKRFEIEAMAMAKLEHPHCAAVVDVGVHEERPFVVMDYVSGDNLRDVIAAGPLPVPRAVEIVRQVLSGLAHAHELGIIHRDIKPANIVLSQKAGLGDHVKILDFGLARFDNQTSSLTTGIVVGTPSYMAPEQIRGVVIDQRTDLYACGVLLFELLTGHKPFVSESDDPIEVCSLHLKEPPPALHDKQPGIEFGPLEAIVARALAKQPEDRYASAVEFATALDVIPTRRSQPIATPIPPVQAIATETGWSVPADARSSVYESPAGAGSEPIPAPLSVPPSAPVPAPLSVPPSAPVPGPLSVPASAPVPGPLSVPPSAPAVAPRSSRPVPQPFGRSVSTPAAGARVVPPPQVAPAGVPPVVVSPMPPVATAPAEMPPVAMPPTPMPAAQLPAAQLPPPVVAPPVTSPSPEPRAGLPSDFDLSLAIPRESTASAKGLSPGFDLSLAIPQETSPILERSGEVSAPTIATSEPSSTGGDTLPASPPPLATTPPTVSPPDAETIPGSTTPATSGPNAETVLALPTVGPALLDADGKPITDARSTVAFVGAPPAGPSPLAAPDAPASLEVVGLPPTPRPPRVLTPRQFKIGFGALVGLVVVIAIIVSVSRSKHRTTQPATDDAATSAPPPQAKPADDAFARARELIDAGNSDAALEQLLAARKVYPDDARLAYLAGTIYFERQWWTVGLKQFRDALALDPTFRSDPELIKIVLKAFITPADYHAELGSFLREDIGPPAREYLEETAQTHPRASTRARAQAELDRMH